MRKVACLFPGQGSQYVGMGKALYEKYDSVRDLFQQANQWLDMDITKLCFEGPQEELNLTSRSQPAIFVFSMACYRLLEDSINGFQPDAVAGLSLGEFTALCASDAIGFEQALGLVKARGEYMDQACLERPGMMASILGLGWKRVEGLCDEVKKDHIVGVANVNTPGQIVVSGQPEGVKKVVELAKASGAKRAIELRVQGAFHSPLMEPAKREFSDYIRRIEIQTPKTNFFSNVTGGQLSDPEQIRQALIDQVTGSVLWVSDVEKMSELGIDTTIELGSGKVLTAFQKKISSDVATLNIEDEESFAATKEQLSN